MKRKYTTEQFATVCNDVSEDMAGRHKPEILRETIRWLMGEMDALQHRFNAFRDTVLVEDLKHLSERTKLITESHGIKEDK